MRLEEINLSAYQYVEAVSDQFTQICEPLFKLGIKYFEYFRVFSDGGYLRLINNIDYCKVYLSVIKEAGPFFKQQATKASINKSYSFLLTDINQFDKKKEPIIHLLYDFDIWNCLKIYKLHADNFMEIYTFSMARNDLQATQLFLNYYPFFEHFINYFNEQAAELISCNDKKKLAYFKSHFDFLAMSQENILVHKAEQFLRETQLMRKLVKGKGVDIRLSKRETQCLEYLALGKSMKEIGRSLELSPRTIEFYLKNIKQKTGIRSKEEIIVNYIKSNQV